MMTSSSSRIELDVIISRLCQCFGKAHSLAGPIENLAAEHEGPRVTPFHQRPRNDGCARALIGNAVEIDIVQNARAIQRSARSHSLRSSRLSRCSDRSLAANRSTSARAEGGTRTSTLTRSAAPPELRYFSMRLRTDTGFPVSCQDNTRIPDTQQGPVGVGPTLRPWPAATAGRRRQTRGRSAPRTAE